MKTMERILSLVVLSLLLTACGGGGSEAVSNVVAPATSGVAMPASVSVVD